jgi:hypothetical protein
MRLTPITPVVALCFAAVIALGGVAACDKSSDSRSPSNPVVAMPQIGTFVVAMAPQEGQPPMMLAVTVDGGNVAAYACNNTNDEAWFFGSQRDAAMDLTSTYGDHLKASYDGTNLNATLTMNDVTYTGAAQLAGPPAGIYTASAGDARASWIVSPDQTVVGVTSANSKRDREVIDQINAQQQAFKDKIRQARLQRQLEQSAKLNTGNFTATVNGTTVTAQRVTGNMQRPPA